MRALEQVEHLPEEEALDHRAAAAFRRHEVERHQQGLSQHQARRQGRGWRPQMARIEMARMLPLACRGRRPMSNGSRHGIASRVKASS